MNATKILRQAAAPTERIPLIKFVGPRVTPAHIDHTPQPHPASPTGRLPSFSASDSGTSAHTTTFFTYRDHAQQHGPLQKTIRLTGVGIGGTSGYQLGPIFPTKGIAFDSSELAPRFHRRRIDSTEMEAIESGGATAFA